MENTNNEIMEEVKKPKLKVRENYDQMLSLPKSVKAKITKLCLHKNKKISHLFCEFINKELENIEGFNAEEKVKSQLVQEQTDIMFAFNLIMNELKSKENSPDTDNILKDILTKLQKYENGNLELIQSMQTELKALSNFKNAYITYSKTGNKSELLKLE